MTKFIFESYGYDSQRGVASFHYKALDPDMAYTETVQLVPAADYDQAVFDRALKLAFLIIGVSYAKSFPTADVSLPGIRLDRWQAEFLSAIYQEGLGQFAFENNLTRDELAHFTPQTDVIETPLPYRGEGTMSLQSGGKDSLLVGQLLRRAGRPFSSLYITSGESYPSVIDRVGDELRIIRRQIDLEALRQSWQQGGKNGHVPVTYIVLVIGLLQTILDGKATLIAAIGHEGEEPHAWIGDLAVNHQWSKTWQAEMLLAEYVAQYISPGLRVGSILRKYSELRIAQLFAATCWQDVSRSFSSCNQANYRQGAKNSQLGWCGECPKCANSYLLFAPFINAAELQALFDGKDLFADPALEETFRGLLGIGDAMKPFECVGEVDELRRAYHLSRQQPGYGSLPFEVPASDFDYKKEYPDQPWVDDIV